MKKVFKNILSRFFVLSFFAFCTIPAFAKRVDFSVGGHTAVLYYNDSVYPGDAVFVKMELKIPVQADSGNNVKIKAGMDFYLGEKALRHSDFYFIHTEEGYCEMLSGIPLSTWWKSGDGYSIKVKISVDDYSEEFFLPCLLLQKNFISEIIPLSPSNTSIKTDDSKERMRQIEKLNAILATCDTTAVYETDAFVPPSKSLYRTSFFADRRTFTYSTGGSSTSLHLGLDYRSPEGTDVYSCAKGKVVLAEWRNSTGWSIVIEHLPGLYSLYYHLREMKVEAGDMVEAGELIGLSGSTGLATGPHLHWEIRLNSEAVNPDFFTTDFTFKRWPR